MKKLFSCLILLGLTAPILTACSFAKLTVRASMPMIEGGIQALNRENDLILAEAAMPPNIELIEGMLINDPDNETLRTYAAQAYYGYAYGFIEDNNKLRASNLYYRGLKHARHALAEQGLSTQTIDGSLDNLHSSLKNLDNDAVPALFWAASCMAKWVDMNRHNAESLAQMPRAVMLMERVLDLDAGFFMGGAHIFFGVYYGSKPPMLGGDYNKSAYYFDQARQVNHNKLLLVDLLQAQYLDRQQFNRDAFHKRLTTIIKSADDIYPEQSLITMIAKNKARLFLSMENSWF